MSTVAEFEPALPRPKIWRPIHSATQYALNLENCYRNFKNNQTEIRYDIQTGKLQK